VSQHTTVLQLTHSTGLQQRWVCWPAGSCLQS